MDLFPPCPECPKHLARIAALEAKLLQLEGRLRDLEDRLKPPPTPTAKKMPPAPGKTPTGRKPGGQPGHPPHLKVLVPAERLKQVIAFIPPTCRKCHQTLPAPAGPADPPPTRHQVAELPPLVAAITEYQGHFRTCPGCGTLSHAVIPADIRSYSVGPHLTAALAYLAGNHGVSKRGLEEICTHLFDAPIALGTVAHLEQQVSAALEPVHQEAKTHVHNAPVKHVDETGWKQAGKKRWLWAAATQLVACFVIQARRNLQALTRVVGEAFVGVLCSDRWCVYDEWPLTRRQLCWAHVSRNWHKHGERGGKAQVLSEAFQDVQRQVFREWHLFRGGGLSRRELGDRIAPLMLAARSVLEQGEASRDPKLRRFCTRLNERFIALWTFVIEEGVEPTNNQAERVQRRAVLWRRRSFGCHSAEGCRFVERILTVVETLRLQKRPVLDFLAQAITAHRASQAPPKLVIPG